jgi:outer membrane protein insertion porin family
MRSWFASALALTASAGAIVAAQDVSRVSDAWGQQPPVPQPQPAQPVQPQPQPPQQPQAPQIISRILVEGNQRIEPRTVLSYLLVKPGDPFDQERIGLSVRALGATGLFADIQIEARGNDLVVRVLENPIINRIMFEGNNAVTTEKLEEETEAEPRQTFTLSRVEQDVQRILEVYRRAGRFAATVTPQYKVLEQNRADLIFAIDEGPTTGVKSINFIGNEAYPDDRLRREITTRQSRWWRFFEQADNYNPGQVEYDRSQLTEFYTNEGYADFRVISSVAELTPDRRDFYLTFTVDEGEKYTFGDLNVETQLEKLSGERLALVLGIKKGEQFRAKSIQDAIDTLTFAAGIAGYANVQIRPRETRDPVNHTIGITFQVDEGARVYIERIDIQGNTQTLDRVIRREIRVAEGDQYNPVQLDNAKSRIRSLGFFKADTVAVDNEPGSTSDRAVVKVKVEEEATGELAFSAGFSSQDAFLFSAPNSATSVDVVSTCLLASRPRRVSRMSSSVSRSRNSRTATWPWVLTSFSRSRISTISPASRTRSSASVAVCYSRYRISIRSACATICVATIFSSTTTWARPPTRIARRPRSSAHRYVTSRVGS